MRRLPSIQASFLVLLLTVVLGVYPSHAFAQSRRAMGGRAKAARPEKPAKPSTDAAPLAQFQKMTSQERQRELAKLPADRRAKLQKQLEHYDKLTPSQREQLDWFNRLPPDRQTAFRNAFQKFQNQPPARQQVMRDELTNLRSLSEADRASRLASPDFKSRYNQHEQEILSDMATALPRT